MSETPTDAKVVAWLVVIAGIFMFGGIVSWKFIAIGAAVLVFAGLTMIAAVIERPR